MASVLLATLLSGQCAAPEEIGEGAHAQQPLGMSRYTATLTRTLSSLAQMPAYRIDDRRGALVQDGPAFADSSGANGENDSYELLHYGAAMTHAGQTQFQIALTPYPRYMMLNSTDVLNAVASRSALTVSPLRVDAYEDCPLNAVRDARLVPSGIRITPGNNGAPRLFVYEDDTLEGGGLVQVVPVERQEPLWLPRACISRVQFPILTGELPLPNSVDVGVARLPEGMIIAYPGKRQRATKEELLARGWQPLDRSVHLEPLLAQHRITAEDYYSASPSGELEVAVVARTDYEKLYNLGIIRPFATTSGPFLSDNLLRLGLAPQVDQKAWLHIHHFHNVFRLLQAELERAASTDDPPDSVIVVTGYYHLTGKLVIDLLDWDDGQYRRRPATERGGADFRAAFPLSWGFYAIDRALGDALRVLRATPVSEWMNMPQRHQQPRAYNNKRVYAFLFHEEWSQEKVWTRLIIEVPDSAQHIDAARVASFYPYGAKSWDIEGPSDRIAYADRIAAELTEKRVEGEHVPLVVFEQLAEYLRTPHGRYPPGFLD